VMVFATKDDAERVLEVLPKRLAKYSLTLHPAKTRLVRFTRPPRPPGTRGDDSPRPGSFDFLGFTHYWGASRSGRWVVKRKTAKERFRRAVTHVNQWCRRFRHLPVKQQHRYLCRLILGHCAYYGITGNSIALGRFRQRLQKAWRHGLSHRSQTGRMTWTRFRRLTERYPLPRALAVHSACRP
jgi:RNA-directed DNA polymerase